MDQSKNRLRMWKKQRLSSKEKQNKHKTDDDDANLPTDLALDTNMPGGSTVKSVFKSRSKKCSTRRWKGLFRIDTFITARTLRNSPRNPDNFIVDETNYERHVKLTFFLFRVSVSLMMMTHFGSPHRIENQEMNRTKNLAVTHMTTVRAAAPPMEPHKRKRNKQKQQKEKWVEAQSSLLFYILFFYTIIQCTMVTCCVCVLVCVLGLSSIINGFLL